MDAFFCALLADFHALSSYIYPSKHLPIYIRLETDQHRLR